MRLIQKPEVKLITFLTISALLFTLGLFAYAQENQTVTDEKASRIVTQEKAAEDMVAEDENITHQDLGVGDPDILPGNPLYFFQGVRRTFKSAVTFDDIKEAELKLKFANEKLMEAKKMAQKTKNPRKLQDALKRYEEEIERMRQQIEKLGGKDKAKVEKLIEKAADNQIKHHKLLGKLMKENEQIAAEIEQKKAGMMKDFTESISKVASPELMEEKFTEAMEKQRGSAFRHFKHLEVLEEVKENVPEEARQAIENAIQQSSKLFEEEFSQMEQEQRELFHKYMEKTGGNEVRHLEAFDSLNAFADIDDEMFDEMEKAREKTRKRVEERMINVKDEARRKVFISHLEGAKLEDARIINELENNLSPETIDSVLEIKHEMEEKMRARFEEAQSAGDLDSFFDEMEKFRDVHMLEALDEIDGVIPEDKKEILREMKKRAMEEMQKSAEEARRRGRFDEEMRRMSGFDPEQMEILDEFEDEFEEEFKFFEEMREKQAEITKERFEHFREFAEENPEEFLHRAEEFRIRIEEDDEVRERIERFEPEIKEHFKRFKEQKENTEISEEKVNKVIEGAELLIKTLEEKLSTTSTAAEERPGLHSSREMLRMAQEHLSLAKKYREEGRFGAAFGKATAAKHLAANGIRHLEMQRFETMRHEFFMEQDRMRMEGGGALPPDKFREFDFEDFDDFDEEKDFDDEDDEDFEFPEKDDEDEIEDSETFENNHNEFDTRVCAQVITLARNTQTKECRIFNSSCLPDGWTADKTCEEALRQRIEEFHEDSSGTGSAEDQRSF